MVTELCPICIDNEAIYFTECGHGYCITCLSHIKKCAMCRKPLIRSTLCSEIKSYGQPKKEHKDYITLEGLQYSIEDFQPSGTANFSRLSVPITFARGFGGLAFST
jgi:hypothetical protein